MAATIETIETLEEATGKYKYGFVTDIESDKAPKGLNEDIIRFISAKKDEPEWMLEWRLKAFAVWQKMDSPDWAKLDIPPIDYQDAYYYAAPKTSDGPASLDEVDPELLRTYEKLGIPISEQKLLAGVVAVDAVFDSVSVATTFRDELAKAGVIFCPISEAIREYPDLIKTYMGSVVPVADNYFSALNAAVFTDGSFVYIPKGVRCPMELSTYFRINEQNTGQFERTLIIAEDSSYVSYLEGCTAPQRDENQPYKIGTPAMKMARGVSIILLPNVGRVAVTGQKFHGHRSKPVRRSHGNIHPVFCRAKIRLANFIRLRLPIISSRPILVQK